MKNTNTCPKCSGTSIAHFKGLSGHWGTGNMLCVGTTVLQSVPIDQYVCCDCGYVEQWIDKKHLEKVKNSKRAIAD
ncbi:MAG: hypothetical protein IKU17_01510 [Clostridia bacterium]|nr:hypothetical protein [Clostridia bacterium]